MANTPPEYLTTRELADLLRVKERKVYELAAAGDLPCTRATGKLLFPRTEVEAWLSRHRSGSPAATEGTARPEVFVGSHDPLLEWALRESGSAIPAFLDGSLDGLERLRRGEAVAAGLHLVESEGDGWNRAHVEAALADEPVVLLEWAWRQQGLVLASGNPLGIRRIADLRGRRFLPRQREAGTWVLFERLAAESGLSLEDLDLLEPPARTQTDIALAMDQGLADAGLGLACAARQFHLDFVPLLQERYDIVVYRSAYFEPAFQRLLAFCRRPEFAHKAEALGGYDTSNLARVHYNAP